MDALKWLIGYMKGHWGKTVFATLLTVVHVIAIFVTPYVTGYIVDNVVKGGQKDLLTICIILLICGSLVRQLTWYIGSELLKEKQLTIREEPGKTADYGGNSARVNPAAHQSAGASNERPEGLRVLRASVGELDENGEWVGKRSDTVSVRDLRKDHRYAYYIELENDTHSQMEFELSMFVGGRKWADTVLRIPPKGSYIWWVACDMNDIGAKDVSWYIGSTRLIEKTLQLTK